MTLKERQIQNRHRHRHQNIITVKHSDIQTYLITDRWKIDIHTYIQIDIQIKYKDKHTEIQTETTRQTRGVNTSQ